MPSRAIPIVMAGLKPLVEVMALERRTPTSEMENCVMEKRPAWPSSRFHWTRKTVRSGPIKVMIMPLRMKLRQSKEKMRVREDVSIVGRVCVFEDIMAFCRSQSARANGCSVNKRGKSRFLLSHTPLGMTIRSVARRLGMTI